VSSIPEAMLTEAQGIELEGTFALAHSLVYDSARPTALALTLRVENGCRVVEAPDELSPERFRSVWTREVKGPDGLPVTIRSGPGTPEWLSYEEIPRVMEIAVLVCEDGGFYRHKGFDFRAIEKALKDDIQAGRFVRGASTISMQLAKNLYLGREKTLSRKLEEALFTMLLESKLSKQELMTLYLNVVELGPGIYGIQQAAKYYFDLSAKELTLGQALYLASILPDPTRQHFEPDGRVSPRWAEYIKKLMRIARSVERITDEELEAGLAEELAFRQGNGASGLREQGDTEEVSDRPDDGFGGD
jgi:membrane peptidoglycan carboxypeptidase